LDDATLQPAEETPKEAPGAPEDEDLSSFFELPEPLSLEKLFAEAIEMLESTETSPIAESVEAETDGLPPESMD